VAELLRGAGVLAGGQVQPQRAQAAQRVPVFGREDGLFEPESKALSSGIARAAKASVQLQFTSTVKLMAGSMAARPARISGRVISCSLSEP
jgi:hypothetical protein